MCLQETKLQQMFVQMVKRLGVGPKWGNGGFLGSFVILEGFGINHGV